MIGFREYIVESSLKAGSVFKTTDKSGDLAGKLLYVKKVDGDQITVITQDGEKAETTITMLDVDIKSIRKYDVSKDPKVFKGE